MRSLFAFVVLLAGCGTPPPRFSPLDSDGKHFRGADGRAVILRGMNARVEGLFDVTFDDGRTRLEPLAPFEAADAFRMRELGFNLLRLPLSWSGLEPEPGHYSATYLDAAARVVDHCRQAGVYVLLDMHQDAWSKEIGEDGAPLWAIVPPPTMLLGGPLEDLGDRRISKQVQDAFKSFFTDNAMMLQERFADAMRVLAVRFSGDPAVMGYEIFNEPVATEDELLVFHTKVARVIRAADPSHLIAFEPSVTRNFTNATVPADRPFPVAGGVYAPHVYTAVFNDDQRLAAGTFGPALVASFRAAREEADAWKTPLFVGELGIGPTQPNAYAWIDQAFDAADETLASTAFDATPAGFVERPAFIEAVARPYAMAIGGDPTSMSWDGTTLTVSFVTRPGVQPLHDLYFPGPAPQLRCNGTPIPPKVTGPSTYQLRCEGTVFAY